MQDINIDRFDKYLHEHQRCVSEAFFEEFLIKYMQHKWKQRKMRGNTWVRQLNKQRLYNMPVHPAGQQHLILPLSRHIRSHQPVLAGFEPLQEELYLSKILVARRPIADRPSIIEAMH